MWFVRGFPDCLKGCTDTKSGIVRSKSLVFYLLNEVTRCLINHWFLREKTVGFRKKNNSEQTHLSFTFWFPSLPL